MGTLEIEFEDNRTLQEFLLEKGYLVTETKKNGDNWDRMITDMEGNELGFVNPMNVFNGAKYSNKKPKDFTYVTDHNLICAIFEFYNIPC